MQLVVKPGGQMACIYAEAIDLAVLGPLAIRRASHVEPDRNGLWRVDLGLSDGPVLGPFARRSAALAAEQTWLLDHWFTADRGP